MESANTASNTRRATGKRALDGGEELLPPAKRPRRDGEAGVEDFICSYKNKTAPGQTQQLLLRVFPGEKDESPVTDVISEIVRPGARSDVPALRYGREELFRTFGLPLEPPGHLAYVGPDGRELRLVGDRDFRVLIHVFECVGIPTGGGPEGTVPRATFRYRSSRQAAARNTIAAAAKRQDLETPDKNAHVPPVRSGSSPPSLKAGADKAFFPPKPRQLDLPATPPASQLTLADSTAAGPDDERRESAAAAGDEDVEKEEEETSDAALHFERDDPMRYFQEAKEFFGYLPGTPANVTNGEGHRIHGIDIALHAFQLVPAFMLLVMAVRERNYGKLNADGTGCGKTFEGLLAWAVVRLVAVMQKHIREHPDRHLRPGGDGYTQPHDAKCLESDRWGIECICKEGGLLDQLVKGGHVREGPLVVIVPIGLLTQWLVAITKFFGLRRPEIWVVDERVPVARRMAGVVYKSPVEMAREGADNEYVVKRDKHGNPVLRCKPSGRLSNVIIVLPSSQALSSLKKRAVYYHKTADGTKWRVEFPVAPTHIVIDEMHKVKGLDTGMWQFVRLLIQRSTAPVFLTGLTGTPITSSPSDLTSFFMNVKSHELRHWRPKPRQDDVDTFFEELEDLTRENARLTGRKDAPDHETRSKEYRRKLTSLMRPYMIRRELSDNFGGKPIVQLPPITHLMLQCETPAEMADGIGALQEKVKTFMTETLKRRQAIWDKQASPIDPRPTMSSVMDKSRDDKSSHFFLLRTLAAFPSLLGWLEGSAAAAAADDDGDDDEEYDQVTFTADEAGRLEKCNTPQDWKKITRHSPKLGRLGEIIDKALADTTKHADLPGGRDHLPKKVVVFAKNAFNATATAAWLKRRYPHVGINLVVSSMREHVREGLYAPFKRDPRTFHTEDDDATDPRILVASIGVAATGQDFIRANYTVMLDPAGMPSDKKQADGRAHRIGQTIETWAYDIICTDNAAEMHIYNRMEKRINLDPWAVKPKGGRQRREDTTVDLT